MSTENVKNENKSAIHTGLMNWPSALMLILWLLAILGYSGITNLEFFDMPYVLISLVIAGVLVTAWSGYRFYKSHQKDA